MSDLSKKNKMNKNSSKNFKIEPLEQRLLMDAAPSESLKSWTEELACVVAPDYWTDQNKMKDNHAVEGLYRKVEDAGSLERATVSDLWTLSDYYNWENESDDVVAKKLTSWDERNNDDNPDNDVKIRVGNTSSYADSNDVLKAIRNDIYSKLESVAKKGNITATKLAEKFNSGKEFVVTTASADCWYKVTCKYDILSSSNDRVKIAASATIDLFGYAEFVDEIGAWNWNKVKKSYDAICDKIDKLYKADTSETNIDVVSDFNFSKLSKELEFVFTLDGSAKNGVDMSSTANVNLEFKSTGKAKYGVLDMTADANPGTDLTIKTQLTDDSNLSVKSGVTADFLLKVANVSEAFIDNNNSLKDKTFKYTKSDAFDEKDKGLWVQNPQIEKYNTFSMGKILEKLQNVSSRLAAIQNGEYSSDNVNFDQILSKNALSLLNLSAMLDGIINNPPQTLQELVKRINENPYQSVVDGKKVVCKISIDASGNFISIPFNLCYYELDEKGNPVTDKIDTTVSLSEDVLSELFCAEVVENKSVEVESSATLSFNLLIPFVDSEKAKWDSSLYQLGLGETNNQLASVIGAKALVGEKMDYDYAGLGDLGSYAKKVYDSCRQYYNADGRGLSNFAYCTDSSNVAYALYFDKNSTSAVLNENVTDASLKFDPTKLNEFKGVSAGCGLVIQWQSTYKSVAYNNVDLKKKERSVVADAEYSATESAASALNALFAQSKNDLVKDAHVVAFDGYLVILINSNAEDICKDFADNLTIGSLKGKDSFAKEKLKEVWISNTLAPARYNSSAVMTITLDEESFDLDLPAGYFNSVTCVAEIATGLQEMINAKFRWNIENAAEGIEYESSKLFVESCDGQIRFVSSQDFCIDFHCKEFAEWLGYTSFAETLDENGDSHILICTSDEYVSQSVMLRSIASTKFHKTTIANEKLPSTFDITVSVDGETKKVNINRSEITSVRWAGELANLLQSKIETAFGWKDSRKFSVTSYNDCICFNSLTDYTLSVTNETVAKWLGFEGRSVAGDNTKRVWISAYKKCYTSSVDNASVSYFLGGGTDKGYISIECGDDLWKYDLTDAVPAKSLQDLARILNSEYASYVSKNSVKNDLMISYKLQQLCFMCSTKFSVTFSGDAENIFGANYASNQSTAVDEEKCIITKYTDNVRTECMEIDVSVGGKKQTIAIDLKKMYVDEFYKSNKEIKDSTVEQIFNSILDALNDGVGSSKKYFVFEKNPNDSTDITIKVNEKYAKENPVIEEIRDINGYTIASMLGLCGKFGIDVDTERATFAVNANILDDYLDTYVDGKLKVPLFENFNLTIENTITQGRFNLPLKVGVFGETAFCEMTGASCTTVIAKSESFRLKELTGLSNNYKVIKISDDKNVDENSNNDVNNWYWKCSLNEGVNAGVVGGVNLSISGNTYYAQLSNDFENQIRYTGDVSSALNTENCTYRTENFAMGDLYTGLSETVCGSWNKQFLGDNATSCVSKVELPVYGKTIIELMGLQAKINELESYLNNDRSCSTLQELVSFITEKTGIVVTAQYNQKYDDEEKFCGFVTTLDFVWNTKVVNKLVELDSLDFNRDDFVLTGLFKTFMDANLVFHSHVELVPTANGTVRIVPDEFRTYIDGEVSITAEDISADMDVNLYEIDSEGKTVLKQASFQVESVPAEGDSPNEGLSRIYLKATVEGYREVDVKLGGVLHVYRYGNHVAPIYIRVAQDQNRENSKGWKIDDGDVGTMECTETPKTVKYLAHSPTTETQEKGNIVLDLSGIESSDLKQTFLLDKLKQAVDGLSDTVRRLQSSVTSVLVNDRVRSIPLVGDSIINAADSLSFLQTDFVEPLRKYVYGKVDGLNAAAVAEKLATLLHDYIPTGSDSSLKISSSKEPVMWAQKIFNQYYKGVQFFENSEEAYWHIRLQVNYTLDENGNFDLGFPGLGLKAEGGVDLSLTVTLDIGFGVSLKDGAFLLLSNGFDGKESQNDEALTKQVESETNTTVHIGDDLKIELKVTPSAMIRGSLGFLAMTAAIEPKTQSIILGVDLNDGKGLKENALQDWKNDYNAKSVIHFNELKSSISTDVNLRGQLDLVAPMTLGIGGYAASAPHIDTTLRVNWSSDFGEGFGTLNHVGFDAIVFDCGSFIKDTIGNVIEKINKVLDPIRPLIKFLQSEIPVLNKLPAGKVSITVLDLIKKFGNQKKMDFRFLDDVIELDNISKKFDEYVNKGFMISEWNILDQASHMVTDTVDGIKEQTTENIEQAKQAGIDYINNKVAGANQAGMDYLNGKISNVESFVENDLFKTYDLAVSVVDKVTGGIDTVSNLANDIVGNVNNYVDYAKETVGSYVNYAKDTANQYINDATNTAKSVVDKVSGLGAWKTTESKETSSVQKPEFGGSWNFPIFDDPKTQIMKLMMGGHADLVIFDMNPLKFSFDWSKSFPIIGPLCADVGFSFGADIDLCFGYDTYGLERWAKSGFKNAGALIDGFYVSDWDPTSGVDVTEISFHSGVVAGASICGRFGVNVGLNLNVDMDLKDPNNDGKIRMTEMAEMLSINPLDTFNVSASISARAYAYLDVVFYRKEWTLWSCGAFDLFKTACKTGATVASQSGDNLVVNVGDFAAGRNVDGDSEDGVDTVTVTVTGETTAEIEILTEKGKTYKNSYTVKGDSLCVYAGEGDDKITVKGGDAQFNVVVYGGAGDDVVDLSGLTLGEGHYAIVMGDVGKDIIKGAKSGTNYLFGETGFVAYTPETKTQKKKISQVAAYVTDDESDNADVIVGGATNTPDKLKTFIFGGDGSDLLIGGSGENYIFGDFGRYTDEGNDLYTVDRYDLFDEGGDDLIYGNSGVDHIYAGAGNDLVNGNGGNDEIHGGQGNDVIYGGSGDDTIYGDDGTDVIFGDAPFKADMVIGRSDNKNNLGSGKSALLPYGFVPHDLKGQKDASGNYISPFFSRDGVLDTIKMFDFNEWFWSKNFADIEADSERQTLITDVRESIESGTYAEKSVTPGSDIIDGGNGADVIFGDDGRNYGDFKSNIKGGNDQIKGSAGNDFIDGDAGNDTIDGGSGVDVVYGGLGNDTLDGGAGNDFVFGDDGWAGYETSSVTDDQWFNKNGFVTPNGESVFGKMLGDAAQTFDLSNDIKSKKHGGDDIIIAGNGSDFVDGQSGDDTYKVQYMGGDNEALTNVMDSGDDAGDRLNVYGSLNDDHIYVRASDANLGVIARVVDDKDPSKIERVNYWKLYENDGVEFASVYAGAGADLIEIDSTLTPMDVDGGNDSDNIQVGVKYTYLPSRLVDANPLDVYDGSVMKIKDGYLSVGTEHSLSVKGGSGNDVIDVYHTDAPLALFGNVGDDTFNINSIVDENSMGIRNHGQISIVGGSVSVSRMDVTATYSLGLHNVTNEINVWGLPYGSTYSLSRGHLLASNLDVSYSGVMDLRLYGSPEQDSYYVHHATNANYSIEGNNGFDHLFCEGSLYTDSRFSEDIEHFPEGITDEDISDMIKEESNKIESENIKVLVFDEDGNDISDRPCLNATSGSVTYGLKLSKKPTSKSVIIRVMLSDIIDDDVMRGVGIPLINGQEKYVYIEFTQSNYNKIHFVTIDVSPSDIIPSNITTCIYHEVLNASKNDVFECPSVVVWTEEGNQDCGKRVPFGFMDTIHRKIEDCDYDAKKKEYSLTIKLNSAIDVNRYYDEEVLVSIKVVGASGELYSQNYSHNSFTGNYKNALSGDKLTLSWVAEKYSEDVDIYITYITQDWNLNDESSVLLNYNLPDYNGDLDFYYVLNENGEQYVVSKTRDSSVDGYFYKVQDSHIIICSNKTGDETFVRGTLSIVSSEMYLDSYFSTDLYEHETHSTSIKARNDRIQNSGFDNRTRTMFVNVGSSEEGVPGDVGKSTCVEIRAPESGSGEKVHVVISSSNPVGEDYCTFSWLGDDGWNCIRTNDLKVELDIPCNKFGLAYVYLEPEAGVTRLITASVD